MKIKKFNNLWTMGLIIFGFILIALYLLKLIVPEFVIKVAQTDSVVRFGNYVDSHKWAYYLFTFFVSMFTYYFYCCACCRKKNLKIIDWFIIIVVNILLYLIQIYLVEYYMYANIISLLLTPCIICLIDKRKDIKFLYSTTITFAIHLIAEALSLSIRDLKIMISNPNIATLTILLIDGFVWLLLLYNYFNYKEKKNNGN